MSKKETSSRYSSAKGKRGKKKSHFSKQIPSTVDASIGVASSAQAASPAAQASVASPVAGVSKPAPAPPAFSRRPASRSWTPARGGRAETGLVTDYSYVTNDLKRIAMTAAAMFVIIGGLSLIIK